MKLMFSILMIIICAGLDVLASTPNTQSSYLIFHTIPEAQNKSSWDFYETARAALSLKLKFMHTSENFIEQKLFLKAHPHANGPSMKHLKISQNFDPMIIPIQKALEEKAIDYGIISYCNPGVEGGVLSCGLYLYGRGDKKVIAAGERNFPVEIQNTKGWASIIVNKFLTGLKVMKDKKVQRQMSEFLKRSSPEKKRPKDYLNLRMGTTLALQKIQDISIPGVSMAMYFGSLQKKFFTEFSYYKTHNSLENSEQSHRYSSYEVTVGVSGLSLPIHQLIWEAQALASYESLHHQASYSDETAQSIGFYLRPGVSFSLAKNINLGMGYTFGKSFLFAYHGNRKNFESKFSHRLGIFGQIQL